MNECLVQQGVVLIPSELRGKLALLSVPHLSYFLRLRGDLKVLMQVIWGVKAARTGAPFGIRSCITKVWLHATETDFQLAPPVNAERKRVRKRLHLN